MCLTPRDAKLLVRFFDAVDSIVTARLLPNATVDERHLTSTLREALDERFTGFHALSYSMNELKADLAADDTALTVNLSIEAREYPPHVERRVNQADLGVIVRYDNHFRPGDSFAKAVLFQAKRLYSSPRTEPQYSESDTFESIDRGQLLRIADLADKHSSLLYFLFYCPRLDAYDQSARRTLRHLTIPTSKWRDYHPMHWLEEYGFLPWWTHIMEYAADPGRHFPGLLASQIHWLRDRYFDNRTEGKIRRRVERDKVPHPSVREVYERLWGDIHALSWFLVYRVLMGYEGSSSDEAIGLARGDGMSQEIGIAPRYTMELRVSVGGEAHG